jgi:hypothetical protein
MNSNQAENAKNQLLNLLKDLGCSENCAEFHTSETASITPNSWNSTVIVNFPDGRVAKGMRHGKRKIDAEIMAAQSAIARIHDEYQILWSIGMRSRMMPRGVMR